MSSSTDFCVSTGDIKYKYDIITIVEAKDIIELKKKAIQLGADGLIFVRINTYTYETGGTVNGLGSYTSHIDQSYYGTAVKIDRRSIQEAPISKYKTIDFTFDNVKYCFSIILEIYKTELFISLSFDNRCPKSIRAISLDLIINTLWGEDIVIDNLHFYPSTANSNQEYIGSRYYSKVSCPLPINDIGKSYEDLTITINKMVYGKELGAMPENTMWGDLLI